MRVRSRLRRRAVTCGLLSAVLVGCGLPAQDQPTVLRATVPPAVSSESPDPDGTKRQVSVAVYLVREQQLVPVRRRVDSPVAVASIVDALVAGPTPQERLAGLRSALLLPLEVDSAVVNSQGLAQIRLGSEVAETGAAERVLLFGQIVLSLIARPGINSVAFSVGAEPLPVPRGDGSLTTDPLRRTDYTALLGT